MPLVTDEDSLLRWREEVLQRTDLDDGYDWNDWPTDYVRRDLERMTMLWNSRRPMGLTGLPPAALRVPPAHRLAWLLGRAEIDGLGEFHFLRVDAQDFLAAFHVGTIDENVAMEAPLRRRAVTADKAAIERHLDNVFRTHPVIGEAGRRNQHAAIDPM